MKRSSEEDTLALHTCCLLKSRTKCWSTSSGFGSEPLESVSPGSMLAEPSVTVSAFVVTAEPPGTATSAASLLTVTYCHLLSQLFLYLPLWTISCLLTRLCWNFWVRLACLSLTALISHKRLRLHIDSMSYVRSMQSGSGTPTVSTNPNQA